MQSEKIDQLVAALLKAQNEMGVAVKDSANPFFKSKYADLATIQGVCEVPLFNNGLVITQGGCMTPQGNGIYTQLTHVSGQWMRSELPLILAKQDPQGVGSAITYFRRYGLAAMLNIEQADDDGNSAALDPKQNGAKEDSVSMQKAGIKRANNIVEYNETNLLHDAEVDAALKKCKVSKLSDLSKTVADELIALGVKREKELG